MCWHIPPSPGPRALEHPSVPALALNQGWSSGEGCGAKSLKEGPRVRRGFWEEQETEEGIWGERGRGRDREGRGRDKEGRGTAQRSGEETQGGRLGVALEVWCPSLGSGFCCWWAILLLAQPSSGPGCLTQMRGRASLSCFPVLGLWQPPHPPRRGWLIPKLTMEFPLSLLTPGPMGAFPGLWPRALWSEHWLLLLLGATSQ